MVLNFKRVIHRGFLANRLVEILDTRVNRSLYFGGKYLQSQMLHKAPEQLALIYTRYMAANLLLANKLQRLLVIGIGAGSIIHFFHHHFPDCHIDCVDNSVEIIELAQNFFQLEESEQVTIHCRDGGDFLASPPTQSPYDLIFIDAFDEEGMAAGIYDAPFFGLCSKRLHSDGVASFNIWHHKKAVVANTIRELQRHFSHSYLLPVPYRGNVVANMLHKPVRWQKLLPKRTVRKELQEKYRIEFDTIGKLAIRKNMSLPKRLGWYLKYL